ncbi:MAG: FHA domain-containing protein [Gemmataceae bacterium]
MSFRLFIYYCGLCGGWAALVGWILGRLLAPGDSVGRDAVLGFSLGLMVAFGLGLVDSVWNLGIRQFGRVSIRVLIGVLVGAVGGLLGGLLGHFLNWLSGGFLFTLAWAFTGLLVGASIGSFEMLSAFITKREGRSARKKFVKCMMGGTIGGFLGGVLAWLFRLAFASLLSSKNEQWLWSPTAWGFVALGAFIGLLVGMAQVLLKEAWIKVEAGFRPGREMILAKDDIVIGRSEGSDVALFGDSGVEKLHASINKIGDQYFIEDKGSAGGTLVNDRPLRGRAPLRSGDLIRVGRSVLRFYERQKR